MHFSCTANTTTVNTTLQAHSSVQLKATVAATALTQPVLSSIAPPMSAISSQSLQGIHPAVTAAVIAGPAAAEGNSTMSASNATPDVPHTMIMPPPVHHTGTTAVPIPYVPSPSLSTYMYVLVAHFTS